MTVHSMPHAEALWDVACILWHTMQVRCGLVHALHVTLRPGEVYHACGESQ